MALARRLVDLWRWPTRCGRRGLTAHDARPVSVNITRLLDLRGNIPSFIYISDGKLHDGHALDLLLPEAAAIYVQFRCQAKLKARERTSGSPGVSDGEYGVAPRPTASRSSDMAYIAAARRSSGLA